MRSISQRRKNNYKRIAIIASIAIPLVVAILFRVKIDGFDLSFLPGIYASINGVTALALVFALIAIKKGKVKLHRLLMGLCLLLSLAFLVMYVAYHVTSDSTPYGGEGFLRYIYYFILISHIFLSIGVVPLVLFTLLRALTGEFKRHRRLAKITFPIWLYVAVTGVVVYMMISPYYV